MPLSAYSLAHPLAHIGHGTLVHSLADQTLTSGVTIAGVGVAFMFGMGHALTPGHGKVAASSYLIGSRGTIKHALILSCVTTVTHTVSVFVLGLVALFASRYFLPEQLYPILSMVGGLSVCGVGFWLLDRQLTAHEHGDHSHTHHVHLDQTSETENKNPLSPLLTLGIAGGVVPCPSALVLLLSAISLHHAAYGIVLVSAFSLGLAVILMAIGLMAVYAHRWLEWLPNHEGTQQLLSRVSAVVVVAVGAILTACSVA